MASIERNVAESFGTTPREMRDQNRKANHSLAYLCLLFCLSMAGYDRRDIAKFLGRRPNSLCQSMYRAEGLFNSSPFFRDAVLKINGGSAIEMPQVSVSQKKFSVSGEAAEIMKRVFLATGVSQREIMSGIRYKRVTRARWIFMLAMRMNGFTTSETGGILGRDHTTVVHGIQRALDLRNTDAGFRRAVDEVLA